MPLDVNNLNLFQNAQFQQFVDFAEKAVAAGKQKAIARIDAGELGGIVNRTIKPGSGDWVGIGAGRLASLKRANNITRDAFLKAVADMFGGVDHIPDSVKEAMKLDDYGKGKPLTARRILAVKAAIDQDGTYARMLGTFSSADSANVAKTKGWTAAELPKLARAAHFLSALTGQDELDSIEQLSTPGTKENRLLNYGGRFLETASNFQEGLRLLDTFTDWFTGVGNEIETNDIPRSPRKEGMSRTLLNADSACFTPNLRLGFEKFVFECIAHDPSFNLAETDATRLFGMENNVATHFFGRHLNEACTQTVAQIPPERRKTFFTAVTMFFPVVDNVEEANMRHRDRGEARDNKLVIARVLKNLDQIAELEAQGELTFQNLARVCVPELPEGSPCEFREVGAALNNVGESVVPILLKNNLSMELMATALNTLEETGCSTEEAVEAAGGGKRPPPVPYMSSGTLGLDAFDGTTKAGRSQLERDLVRPENYSYEKSKTVLLSKESNAFTFHFPGEEPIATNRTEQGKKNIGTVLNKIETLCGKNRPSQASSVMAMVSQSGLSILRGGLSIYGIDTNEHGACDFTLSKNEATGDVTIKYSSPKELPFTFEWTATVRSDGYVTTTPFKFLSEQQLADAHKADVEELKNAIGGVGFTAARNEAAEKAAEMIVASAAGDRDLMDLLKMDNYQVVKGFARDFRNEVRSPDEIAVRLQRVKENLDELRTAAKGDPRLFQTGLKHLVLFNGGALKSGTITRLCEMAAREDVSGFQGLSESSSPEDIFEAMCKLDRIVNKLCRESQILENFHEGGGDEAAGVNSFIAGLVFARCDDKALAGFKAAMKSDNGQQMYSAMMQLNDGDFPKGYTIAPQTCNVIQHRVARSLGLSFHEATWTTLHTVLGQPPGYDLTSFSQRPVEDASFRKITDIIVKHVEEVYGSELYDAQINP